MYLYPVIFTRGWIPGEVSSAKTSGERFWAGTDAGEVIVNKNNINRNIFLAFILSSFLVLSDSVLAKKFLT